MDTHDPLSDLRIPVPCPMRWGELQGDGRKRFCSSCSLHVHDTAQLTRSAARELLEQAGGRVCLRIEYDATGAAQFRASRWAALWRGAVAALAGLLAVCGTGGKSQALQLDKATSQCLVAERRQVVMGSPAPGGPAPKPAPEPKKKPNPKPGRPPGKG